MPLHQTSGKWRLGLALSLVTVFLWGILPIALKVTVQALDVYTLTWFRFLLSFSLLASYLAAKQQLPVLSKWRSLPLKLLTVAIIFLSANYAMFVQGLAMTSASNAEVVIQFAPVLMGLGAIVVFKERYNWQQWVGLGVLVLGFVLFFNQQLKLLITASHQYLLGSALVVGGAITWAVYSLAQKQLLQKLSSVQIMLLLYGGCWALFTPLASPTALLKLTSLQWGMLIFCGLNTLVAYGAFAEALEHWEASKISAVLALAPIITLIAVDVVALLFPNLIAPEYITELGVLGAVLVVAGSMAIALGKKSA